MAPIIIRLLFFLLGRNSKVMVGAYVIDLQYLDLVCLKAKAAAELLNEAHSIGHLCVMS